MTHKRKVTKEGRVNIPIEIMESFGIKVDDFVNVSATPEGILITKYFEENFCVIMRKVYPLEKLNKIGEVYISDEGLALIKAQSKEKV